MPGEDHETFGAHLQRLMKANGLNQSTLSQKSGIERSGVNRLISGKARPKHYQIVWLAKVFDVDVDELAAHAEQEVRRELVRAQDESERMRHVQSERDQALARVAQLETEIVRERDERTLERAEFDAAWSSRLKALERDAASCQEASERIITSLRSRVDALERQLALKGRVRSTHSERSTVFDRTR